MCRAIGRGDWEKLTGSISRCWATTQKRQKILCWSTGFPQEQNSKEKDLPPLNLRGALKLSKSQVLGRTLSLQSGEMY